MSTIPLICLLIDDDADDQEIFGMALRQMVVPTESRFMTDSVLAVEVLNAEIDFLPDCIFIDINMPRMNGVECLEKISGIHRLKNVPVCMLSTSADPSIVKKSRELGALNFIVKPANVDELSLLVGKFFKENVVGNNG